MSATSLEPPYPPAQWVRGLFPWRAGTWTWQLVLIYLRTEKCSERKWYTVLVIILYLTHLVAKFVQLRMIGWLVNIGCVGDSVTNNDGFWIAWLDLYTASLLPLLYTVNYNSSHSIYCRRLAPFSSFCLSSLTTSELTQRSHVSSLYNLGKNRIEATTSNSSSVIVCLFVAAELCLASRCLEINVSAVLLWLHNSSVQASRHVTSALVRGTKKNEENSP
jgi:hypothetical protein